MIDFIITNSNKILKSNTSKDLKFFKDFNSHYKLTIKSKFKFWKNKKKESFFYLSNKFSNFKRKDLEDPIQSKNLEGSFIILKITKNKILNLWTDKFSKEDIFYTFKNDCYYISTSLENLFINVDNDGYDKFGISQSLIIYGNRPSKKNTFYKKVKRLGYYEKLEINSNIVNTIQLTPEILNSKIYTKNHLNNYFDIFINTLEKNSSKYDNIVFMSSGWDSSAILAGLRYIYGPRKVRCLTVKQNYSEKYGITNLPEIRKAKQIADYYNVKIDFINLNYLSEEFIMNYLNKLDNLFKSKNYNMLVGLSHFLLNEKAAKLRTSTDTTVFTGEMSDGSHNLGFSQYATIFHPSSKSFREYSDKMLSYLFGPTFFKSIEKGDYNNDPVWKILSQVFDKKAEDVTKINSLSKKKKIFLRSFFAQSSRFPLSSLDNEIFLTNKGKIEYNNYMNKNYFNYYSKILNEKNHYSVFLNLYNSFHWQGSTVATLKLCADFHDLNISNPFNSIEMFNFLSEMNEDWGRGLNFNSTKYHLKEMLKDKLNYPLSLQSGDHAYIYDSNFAFSHNRELLIRSKLRNIAKKKLQESKIINNLDKNYFNVPYINGLVNKYKKDQNLNLKEINDLYSIVVNSLIDSY